MNPSTPVANLPMTSPGSPPIAEGGAKTQQIIPTKKSFPVKLYLILERCSTSLDPSGEAVSWLPHGRGFLVKNKKLFTNKVMPYSRPRSGDHSRGNFIFGALIG